MTAPSTALSARFIPVVGRFCDICKETLHTAYAHKHTDGTWHVPASEGGYYRATILSDGTADCGCSGFHYRKECRHSELIVRLEAQGRKHDLAHATFIRYEQLRWPPDIQLTDIR